MPFGEDGAIDKLSERLGPPLEISEHNQGTSDPPQNQKDLPYENFSSRHPTKMQFSAVIVLLACAATIVAAPVKGPRTFALTTPPFSSPKFPVSSLIPNLRPCFRLRLMPSRSARGQLRADGGRGGPRPRRDLRGPQDGR